MSMQSCHTYLLAIDEAPRPMRVLAWSSTDSQRGALAMTPEAIRRLDGPSLTRLAYSLGLSPPGTHSATGQLLTVLPGLVSPPFPWTPHLSLPQAAVVFSSLRERGWRISTWSQRADGPGIPVLFGMAAAWWEDEVKVGIEWSTLQSDDPQLERSEAMALLLVAVIATATHDGLFYRYASSWHRTLGEALRVMAERQAEGYTTVSLVPPERSV